LEYGFFGSNSPNFTKNRVGCPRKEGTFGTIEGAFEVFDPNKMYAKVSHLTTYGNMDPAILHRFIQ